jgi:hypothetical protein
MGVLRTSTCSRNSGFFALVLKVVVVIPFIGMYLFSQNRLKAGGDQYRALLGEGFDLRYSDLPRNGRKNTLDVRWLGAGQLRTGVNNIRLAAATPIAFLNSLGRSPVLQQGSVPV